MPTSAVHVAPIMSFFKINCESRLILDYKKKPNFICEIVTKST